MHDYCLWQWIKEEGNHISTPTLVSTVPQVVFPPSPLRYAIILPAFAPGGIRYQFGTDFGTQGSFDGPTAGAPAVFTYEQIGPAIQEQFVAFMTAGTYNTVYHSFEWHPARKALYDRMMYEYFSKFGTS